MLPNARSCCLQTGNVVPRGYLCDVDGAVVPSGDVGKCLGFWWKSDLLSSKSIINKAQRAFFNFGSIGVFSDDISPLSSRFVLETCVMPFLLYGSENWILTESLLKKLESFQGELAKRILKWPKHLSNTAPMTCLDLPLLHYRILVSKLSFLMRLLKMGDKVLGGSVVLSLCDDFEEACLVRECKDLENVFGTNLTGQILSKCSDDMREVKAE